MSGRSLNVYSSYDCSVAIYASQTRSLRDTLLCRSRVRGKGRLRHAPAQFRAYASRSSGAHAASAIHPALLTPALPMMLEQAARLARTLEREPAA
jgi:hypothetical protein